MKLKFKKIHLNNDKIDNISSYNSRIDLKRDEKKVFHGRSTKSKNVYRTGASLQKAC